MNHRHRMCFRSIGEHRNHPTRDEEQEQKMRHPQQVTMTVEIPKLDQIQHGLPPFSVQPEGDECIF
jgi:hypothetical protein